MTFEEYLIRKKIDQKAFAEAEQALFESWKSEFEQVHPDSFTVQKLNLINPIRRKYTLKELIKPTLLEEVKSDQVAAPVNVSAAVAPSDDPNPESTEAKPPSAPKPARPVFKPRPKIN